MTLSSFTIKVLKIVWKVDVRAERDFVPPHGLNINPHWDISIPDLLYFLILYL